ncbi:MAG: transporter substrate-binding domain-containing protein [Spirochaetia bacterium]|jgi:ABC-type amino acid transport substrate-binding protein|nr:transporter substrate-binding domain-containing protein [Spirochaetia bacterium]
MPKIFLSLFFIFNSTLFIWSADLDEILDKNSITAGIRKLSTATYLGEEFSNKGFCYDLANAFAEDLGVDFNLKVIEDFTEYWEKEGKIVFNSNQAVTPDIYNEIDLAADIFTVSDKRKKYVNMVPFVENTEIFIGKKDLKISSYEDIRGLRIFTLESVSFYQLIKDELDARQIPFVVNPIEADDSGEISFPSGRSAVPENGVEIIIIPKDVSYPKFAVYHQLLLDHADLTIQDSFSFFLHYSTSLTFRNGLRSLFPLRDETGYLAFCTSYESEKLNKSLAEFMNRYKKSDEFEILFKQYMGIGYKDYKSLLNITQQAGN